MLAIIEAHIDVAPSRDIATLARRAMQYKEAIDQLEAEQKAKSAKGKTPAELREQLTSQFHSMADPLLEIAVRVYCERNRCKVVPV